jgi:hypothetical protein
MENLFMGRLPLKADPARMEAPLTRKSSNYHGDIDHRLSNRLQFSRQDGKRLEFSFSSP